MKKSKKSLKDSLIESGVFGVLGFLAATLLPIAIWKTEEGNKFILNGEAWLPFVLSPAFALLGTAFMAGYVGFKEKFVTVDKRGEKSYSLFWLVFIMLTLLSLGVAIEAVMEA